MVSLRLQTNWTSYADDVVSRARALRFLGGFACGARVRFGCLRRVDFLGLRALVWRVLCFFLLFLCGSWRFFVCLLRLRCEQEQIERAPGELALTARGHHESSSLAAGPTGSSSGSGSSSSGGAGQAASTGGGSSRVCQCRSGGAAESGINWGWS